MVVSGGCLSCRALSVNYEGGSSFSEYISIPLPRRFSLGVLDDLLQGLLVKWGKEIEWDIVDCVSGVCLPPGPSRIGVGGASLLVSPEYYEDDFRSSVLSTEAVKYDDQLEVSSLPSLMRKVGASDAIFVNLGWNEFSVIHGTSGTSAPLIADGATQISEFRVPALTLADVLKTNLYSLMAVNLHQSDFEDLLANIFDNRAGDTNSTVVVDILRAYVTANLFRVQDKGFKRFGMQTSAGHVFVTGDIACVLPESCLVLAVVDGLQLKGRFVISVDKEYRYIVGSVKHKRDEFICPVSEIYKGGNLYISTEKGGSGKPGKVGFHGRIVTDAKMKTENGIEKVAVPENERAIVGDAGVIHSFELTGKGKVFLKPEKSVYFPNLMREGSELVAEVGNAVKRLIIDMRPLPVVYGPDVNANQRRVAEWLRGIKLNG